MWPGDMWAVTDIGERIACLGKVTHDLDDSGIEAQIRVLRGLPDHRFMVSVAVGYEELFGEGEGGGRAFLPALSVFAEDVDFDVQMAPRT